jgi:hypothetical protein
MAFGGVKRPEVVVAAVERDDRAVAGFVEAVLGLAGGTGHGTRLRVGKTVHVPSNFRSLCRTPDRREVH